MAVSTNSSANTRSVYCNFQQAVREAATMCPAPSDLDLSLTLKVVSESRVTWATSVPILVFPGLSLLDLGPMYTTDVRRQTDVRQLNHLIVPPRVGV